MKYVKEKIPDLNMTELFCRYRKSILYFIFTLHTFIIVFNLCQYFRFFVLHFKLRIIFISRWFSFHSPLCFMSKQTCARPTITKAVIFCNYFTSCRKYQIYHNIILISLFKEPASVTNAVPNHGH